MILRNFKEMRIYLKVGPTDMRKSINTLSILVEESMQLDPFGKSLFVFCNKRREIMKILYWDNNGFALWQKRLEKEKFKWPWKEDEVIEINYLQLSWLLSGLDFSSAHEKLEYKSVI